MRTRILSVVTVMLLVQAGTTWRAEAQERQNLKGLSGIAVHAGAFGHANRKRVETEASRCRNHHCGCSSTTPLWQAGQSLGKPGRPSVCDRSKLLLCAD